jgi:TolB protein
MFRFGLFAVVSVFACDMKAQEPSPLLGVFEGQTDVGSVAHPGSAEYDAGTRSYVVAGSGENMWSTRDDFHYVWRKVSSADVTLTASLAIVGTGGEGHRKGVLMIRQNLDPDSAYVDAARHGDGLTSLQYRDGNGAITREIEAYVSGPARLRLEKQGDRFYMWISAENEPLQFSGGSARVEMHAPFYVGIGVCAHRKDAVEKVAFTNVAIETRVTHPRAAYSTVETVLLSGDARSGYVSPKHLIAPGWTPDGRAHTFEMDGQRQEAPFIPLKTAAPVGTPVTAQTENTFIYFAAPQSGVSRIWRKTSDAGEPELLMSDEFDNSSPSLSPDGRYLVFLTCATGAATLTANQEMSLRVMSLADRSVKTIAKFTGAPGSLGTAPWSPDGRRIAFISYQTMDPGR